MQRVFDYVIVGAGSAGCALAHRLSANPTNRVALIEAGPQDRSIWIHIPVGYFKTMGHPRSDWCYRTQKDAGLNHRSIPWPRGRVLGGSSSINGLLYVRGQPQDFDDWANLGNEGWDWKNVEPYFKRSECWHGEPSAARGTHGPLQVSKTRISRPIVDAWVQAAENAGYPHNSDYNSGEQEGVGLFQLTAFKGRRCSSAVAYLHPLSKRKNLTVMTEQCAMRLLLEQKRAIGVQLESAQILSKREVILCAGAIGSPQLLMVSGIGPRDALKQAGIEVVHELSGVGQNLQDHLQARPVYRCKSSTINTEINSWFKKALIGLEYLTRRSGPMTMAASLGVGFLKTRYATDRPDIQFHIQPFSADSPAEPPHSFDAFTASVLQLRPQSRGYLLPTSKRFSDSPEIHPNYLATKLDCQTVVEGLRVARRICSFEPLRSLLVSEHAPGPEIADDDEQGLLSWIRDSAATIYHPTGTCKMGVDEHAVVDPQLRVCGIKGLRVADASIMPNIVSGNTNAAAIMIGEKVAALIDRAPVDRERV